MKGQFRLLPLVLSVALAGAVQATSALAAAPSSPLQTTRAAWFAYEVEVQGNYACITELSGLRIIDVSNPDAPVDAGVSQAVWNCHCGGYQVSEKWLKDRKGRVLSADDMAHYHRIVIALHETIRLMGEIDAVIEAYGGWPAAFSAASE